MVSMPDGWERVSSVSGGLGLIQTMIRSGVNGIDDANKKDFGSNLGGGAMGFFNDHVGLRGDVNFDLGSFDFWRAPVGVVLR